MEKVFLGDGAFTSNGSLSVLLAALPDRVGRAGLAYLAAIEIDFNGTSINTGTAGSNPIDLHNLISRATVFDGGGKVWGPDGLSGSELAALRYSLTGEVLPFADANGDAAIAASQNAVARRWRTRFDWTAFGADDEDFTVPCTRLKEGRLLIQFAATTATILTAVTGSVRVYGYINPSKKVKAVSRLRVSVDGITQKNAPLQRSGLVVAMILESTANIVATDVATINLKDADGTIVLGSVEPAATMPSWLNFNPEVTTSRVQRHFVDNVGGTAARFMPLVPFMKRQPMSRLPESHKFTYEITGSTFTIANYSMMIAAVEPNDRDTVFSQVGGCGCDTAKLAGKDVAQIALPVGKNGLPVTDGRLTPYMPHVVHDPEILAHASGK